MHARVEHLLSLRDGAPVDADVRRHVERCARCTRALEETVRLRERLRALPLAEPAPGGWVAVRDRLGRRTDAARRQRRLARWAVAASLGVIAIAIGGRLGDPATDGTAAPRAAAVTAEEALALDRVAQLRSRSAALEDALALLGERPVVQRAGMAVPIDSLETQVQWLDHRISDSVDAQEAERLWRDRVETMDSLVRLRYVEAQRVAM